MLAHNRKLKSGLVIAVALMIVFAITGCKASEKDDLTGTWYYANGKVFATLNSDGTAENVDDSDLTWTWSVLDDGRLCFTDSKDRPVRWRYSLDGDTMTLEGDLVVYRNHIPDSSSVSLEE